MSELPDWTAVADLPYAFGGPTLIGILKSCPEDFQVDEILGFEPDGDGEHAALLICKTGMNTELVARSLARLAGIKPMNVGYCGLKDRHAVTTQWFSVGLAGQRQPDWSELESDQLQILEVQRHGRKLRRGTAKGNRFRIRVRDLAGDREATDGRLSAIRPDGVPNYFGEQRFGRDYGNLIQASGLFSGEIKRVKPHLKGLYLSAARSQIFNQLLGLRVEQGNWNHELAGDLMQLDGSHSWFAVSEDDADIEERLHRMDIHPTGPMWGRGSLPSTGQTGAMEQQIAERFSPWCEGLERFGLKQERRALRMPVREMEWHWRDDSLEVAFTLPTGCFATAVLRELVDVQEKSTSSSATSG